MPRVDGIERRADRGASAVAGALAVAAAIGIAELAAGLVPGVPSLLASVGSAVIDLQPPGAKDLVVALFGQNDKLALEVFIVAVALVIGAVVGAASTGRPSIATATFGAFGLLAFAATLLDPQSSPGLAAIAAGGAAWLGLTVLRRLTGAAARPSGNGGSDAPDAPRRRFLVTAGVALAAGAAGLLGRALLDARARAVATAGRVPPPARVAAIPPGASLDVPGITPLVVDNASFYRIDTALLLPSVDVATWRLRIHGMVERETSLTFDELVELPTFEQYVTIACVSNEVGGDLVGNAKWTGVSLRDVLDMAGVDPSATQLVGRSVDGFTAGMPTAWVLDPVREPMIAVLMNDEPLPVAHGYPARLVVPGLYGYVSATKWLSELELTTLEAFDAFWIPRGWAKEAPILTQSRIDVPRRGARVAAGRVTVAGVAWAPDRGVSAVEVAIDDQWQRAAVSAPISDATWVQWRLDWDAAPGGHTIAVRATDGEGEVQTDRTSPPAPDGARGHHTIRVEVAPA